MPLKLTIAWIGKTKNAAIQSLTDEYLKRLRQYAEAEGVSLKDEPALPKLCGRDGKGPRRRLGIPFRWYSPLVRPTASVKQPASRPISRFL